MTQDLPPLHEPDDGITRRADSNVTRPTASIPHVPTRPPTQAPPQGAHIQPTRGQRPPTAQYPRPVRPPAPQDNALYLPWWSLVVMLLLVMVVVFGVVGVVFVLGANQPPAEVTPIIRIITAQPFTQNAPAPLLQEPPVLPSGNSVPPPQLALEGPTLPPVLFTPTPVPITLGSTVTVRGVDAQQLNVRDNAGVLGTTVLFRAPEGTNFTIVDGPNQADGFTWWKIQSVSNPAQSGWAVANYLQAVVGGN